MTKTMYTAPEILVRRLKQVMTAVTLQICTVVTQCDNQRSQQVSIFPACAGADATLPGGHRDMSQSGNSA